VAQAEKAKVAQRAQRRIIERPRLLEQLEETDARTILLVAPAGYGKTTLAQQWMRGRKRSAWYTASAASRDVVVLSRDVADAVTSALGSSASHFTEFLQTIENPVRDASRIVDTLTDAIACSGLAQLVIDDYQAISGSPQAEDAIDLLRRRTSLRIVITSRSRPSWATARKILYGEIREFTQDDLAMTSEETEAFLGSVTSAALTDIAGQACGWPAVLGLAALAGDGTPPYDTLPLALYDFFAEELLRSAEPSLQDALVTLALLPTLTPRLLNGAFGEGSTAVLAKARELGAISMVHDSYELHPLFRDFLIAKLQRAPEAAARVRQALGLALETSSWDTAIQLIRRFELSDLIEPFLCAAFQPLLKSGRIGTLAQFDKYVRALPLDPLPSLDLIAADIALRDEKHSRAEEISLRVARQLGEHHPLVSHAYSVAGHAAFSSWHASRAASHFRRACDVAASDDDAGEAIWGIALLAIYGETGHLAEAVEALKNRCDQSPVDLVRYAHARLALARVGEGFTDVPDLEDALHVARNLDDPRVRTGFSHPYSYYRALQSHYAEASAVARETLHDAQAFELTFVMPHAYWNLALALLGMRRFAEADKALRHVERNASETENPYHTLNAHCLRARFFLTLNQLERAREEVAEDLLPAPLRASLQEYQGTRALVYAVGDDHELAIACAHEASQPGAPVEARTLSAMAGAVIAAKHQDKAGVEAGVARCRDLGTWDAFVCAVRAYPPLLALAVDQPNVRSQIERVLSRSNDFALGRNVGLRVTAPENSTSRLLSPREREVFDLLKSGLTNREIGQALFISEATAKVHVRHVMEKLQVRTRTAAASRVID